LGKCTSEGKINPSFCYVKVRKDKGRDNGKDKEELDGKVCLSLYTIIENISFPFNFDTIGGILEHGCYTAPCFVNQRNYETRAMQAHALTRKPTSTA
jgi:hypothetical protein